MVEAKFEYFNGFLVESWETIGAGGETFCWNDGVLVVDNSACFVM